ncbi:MAG: MoxR family ATPase [Planctomycetes bacterium]|nr:MoxR family ATPase [Planctomycetota bacterium]
MDTGIFAAIRQELAKAVFGQEETLDLTLCALLCGGHALLEGMPGTGKTLTVKALSRAVGCEFKRIQFTPDLMPSDVIGTNVFNFADSAFVLRRGPIFTDLLLADEINRAPAKTQSGLLEAMSERQATIDGVRYPLSPVFSVFATQNPVEYEGTYPLPEAQLDRFLLKIAIPLPEEAEEKRLLHAAHAGRAADEAGLAAISPVVSREELLGRRQELVSIRVEEEVVDYLLAVVRAVRRDEAVAVGPGPRGSLGLLTACKARAAINGRDFVIPDDVAALAVPVLGHRLTLEADAEIRGATAAEVVTAAAGTVEVPR